jgi:FkbH-like protein
MKITEALNIVNLADPGAHPYDVLLLTGFTPLHLQTFLAAHLQLALPERRVKVHTGLFGNLADELEKAAKTGIPNIVGVVEWADIDPRLGYRAAAAWDAAALSDIQFAAPVAFARLRQAIERLTEVANVVLCPPTLPLPPIFRNAGWEAGPLELFLLKLLAEFNLATSESRISVVNQARFAEESHAGQRHDLKSDLYAGFPYSLIHADAVASTLSRLLCPPIPKKGLITDLDDTLWSGTVGEVGAEGVHWNLDGHSHVHALYQSLLASLADSGVLLGVSSKNDPQIVERAFEREDMLLRKEQIFPLEVHWQSKASSVARILRAWNVSTDAVVFVDDNALELAEVGESHPGITCISFSAKDPGLACSSLRNIRDLFGRPPSSTENALRLDSLRQGLRFQEEASEAQAESFIRGLNATVRIENDPKVASGRSLELVNKTNQFNMNGIRYAESDWVSELSRTDTTLMLASYEDRFGKLGRIGVILGQLDRGSFRIKVWVMSCRAFGRRIEFLCLRECFDRYSCPLLFDFEPTPRNGPFRDFLRSVLGHEGEGSLVLTREQFDKVCPPLYQTVTEEGRRVTIHG